MPFTLPDLPYAHDALEPHIDARTMEIHHGKHHAGYAAKLNAAVEGTDMAGMAIEDILRRGADALPGAVRNNGGGYANHNLFWQILAPGTDQDSRYVGGLSDALDAAGTARFDTYDNFKKAFADAAATRFGSGWAWLVVKPDGGVDVYSTSNQDSPYMQGDTPILGLDVWEHAYYLNYQNRRPDYIEAFFKVINWAKVSELYAAATAG